MAEELKDPDFCAQADKWTLQDKSDFSDYAVSMGKAADIHKPVYGENRYCCVCVIMSVLFDV